MGVRKKLAGPAAFSIVAAAALAGVPSAAAEECVKCEPLTGTELALLKIATNPGSADAAFLKWAEGPAFQKLEAVFGKDEGGPLGPFIKCC